MTYWEKVVQRASVPGLLLVTVGAVLCFQGDKLCGLLWKQRGEKAILPMRLIGLGLVVLGALILLDIIPGL